MENAPERREVGMNVCSSTSERMSIFGIDSIASGRVRILRIVVFTRNAEGSAVSSDRA